jgi:hypothetical protein
LTGVTRPCWDVAATVASKGFGTVETKIAHLHPPKRQRCKANHLLRFRAGACRNLPAGLANCTMRPVWSFSDQADACAIKGDRAK